VTSNYKLNTTKRVHFTDLRIDYLKNDYFLKTYTTYKDFFEQNKSTTFFILSLQSAFKDGKLTRYFKEWHPHLYNQVLGVTPDIIEKIKIPILKKIDKYLEYYDNHSLIEKDFKDMTSFLRYYQILTAFLADIYTILRIMKYDSFGEYNNCILYVGDAHIEGIEEMLSTLDFKLIDSKKSDTYDPLMRFNSPPIEGEIQCVKNIIQFDKFFLS
jgi:hypothetical protein